MMFDNVKVAVRVRPLIQRELKDGLSMLWNVEDKNIYCSSSIDLRFNEIFTFDHIFSTESTNRDIHSLIISPLVNSCLEGFNCTIFAYGQTSSGKTHTMDGTKSDPGIIPQVVDELFSLINAKDDYKFHIRIAYIEIYNERVYDLLECSDEVKIREDIKGNIIICATEKIIQSREQVVELIKVGKKNRKTFATKMNVQSSRSHTIFRLIVECSNTSEGPDAKVQVSHFNLVDLAGSERVAQTKATGQRLVEGGHINKSLSTLALVISQLADGSKFVSYRDSKLTLMLRNSLGGNARTLIVANITPASLDDTYSTLLFAKRAKTIKNQPSVNVISNEKSYLRECQEQIDKLQKELNSLKTENIGLTVNNAEALEKINALEERIRFNNRLFIRRTDYTNRISEGFVPMSTSKRRHTIHAGKLPRGAIEEPADVNWELSSVPTTGLERNLLDVTRAWEELHGSRKPFEAQLMNLTLDDYTTSADIDVTDYDDRDLDMSNYSVADVDEAEEDECSQEALNVTSLDQVPSVKLARNEENSGLSCNAEECVEFEKRVESETTKYVKSMIHFFNTVTVKCAQQAEQIKQLISENKMLRSCTEDHDDQFAGRLLQGNENSTWKLNGDIIKAESMETDIEEINAVAAEKPFQNLHKTHAHDDNAHEIIAKLKKDNGIMSLRIDELTKALAKAHNESIDVHPPHDETLETFEFCRNCIKCKPERRESATASRESTATDFNRSIHDTPLTDGAQTLDEIVRDLTLLRGVLSSTADPRGGNEELHRAFGESEGDLDGYNAKLKDTEIKLNELEVQLKNSEVESTNLKVELKNVSDLIDKIDAKNSLGRSNESTPEDLKGKIEKIAEEMSRLRENEARFVAMERENGALKLQLGDKVGICEEVLEKNARTIEKYETTIEELNAELRIRNKEMSKVNAEIIALELADEENKKTIEQLNREIIKIKNEYQSDSDEQSKIINSQAVEITSLTETKNTLVRSNESMFKLIKNFEEEIAGNAAKLNEAETKFISIQRENEELSARLDEKIEELERRTKSAEELKLELRLRNEDTSRINAELVKAEEEHKIAIEKLHEEIVKVKSESKYHLDQQLKVINDLTAAISRFANAENSKILELQSSNAELTKTAADQEKLIVALKRQAESTKENDQIVDQLRRENSKLNELAAELKRVEFEYRETLKTLKRKDEIVKDLASKCDDANVKLREFNDRLKLSDEKLKMSEEKYKVCEEKLKVSEEKLRLINSSSTLNHEAMALLEKDSEITSLREKIAELEEKLADADRELRKLKLSLRSSESQLAETRKAKRNFFQDAQRDISCSKCIEYAEKVKLTEQNYLYQRSRAEAAAQYKALLETEKQKSDDFRRQLEQLQPKIADQVKELEVLKRKYGMAKSIIRRSKMESDQIAFGEAPIDIP